MPNQGATTLSKFMLFVVGALALTGGLMACASREAPQAWPVSQSSAPQRPLVLAHRGASGYLPEHTLPAYEKAIEMGADYIEPDLVATKDGVLVARHENEISETTDVAKKFPSRKRTKKIDGESVTGWFTEDFTLAELKTLRARERLPFRDRSNDGRFPIATFDEVVELAVRKSHELGRPIGVYPETKHPTYFGSIGLALEDALLEVLRKHGLDRPDAPVFIQSFETANLKELSKKTRVRLVQLIGGPADRPYDFVNAKDPRRYKDLVTPAGLAEIATYAQGLGPNKGYIIPEEPETKRLLPPTGLVAAAHRAGLVVHAWTFRSDPQYLNRAYAGDPSREYEAFYKLGVDGVFSDFTDHAVQAREKFLGRSR